MVYQILGGLWIRLIDVLLAVPCTMWKSTIVCQSCEKIGEGERGKFHFQIIYKGKRNYVKKRLKRIFSVEIGD